MVTFYFQVALEGDTERKLFSPPQNWQVLPRKDEWVQADEELDSATPVLDVWHFMHMGQPCIVVELSDLGSRDFEALKTWTDRRPYHLS